MPNPSTTTVKHISLERLELYDSLIKDYIDAEDAKSLKTVAISADGKSLNFYRIEEPVGTTTPDYTIEFPEPDLNPYMQKVAAAINGNLPKFGTNGQVVDSGISADSVATKAYVDEQVAGIVDQTSHLRKEVVTVLPTAANASENVIYMIKDASATGGDQYEEWMLISGELVMIGDTSTNLSGYATTSDVETKIAAAKAGALAEAKADYETKIDVALGDAKDYTDNQIAPVITRVGTLETNYSALSDNVDSLNTTVGNHTTRIEALESGGVDIEIATEEDIMALFPNATP